MSYDIDKFLGKKVWICPFIGKRLNLNPQSFSFCHETFAGEGNNVELTESLLEAYNQAMYRLIEGNMDKESACRKCPKCVEKIYEDKQITYVTVNTSDYCNSSCIYCSAHFGHEGEGYNPIPYIEQFYEADMFAKNCYFDWGGGEPTLNVTYA